MRRYSCLAMLSFVAVVLGVACTSQAVPVIGGNIFVQTTGEVFATKLPFDAAYSSDLYLYSPANGLDVIFNNFGTPNGTTKSLGVFSAGTELVFELHVLNTNTSYFTGPGSRNPDELPHAMIDDTALPGQTLVGFEDMWGAGPTNGGDYNDLNFSFTNVASQRPSDPSVPEPVTMLSCAFGVMAAAGASKRRCRAGAAR